MYKQHPDFKSPNSNTTIWRYRTSSRFESLIQDSCLFFSSIEKLQKDMDSFEGIAPPTNRDFFKQHAEDFYDSQKLLAQDKENMMKFSMEHYDSLELTDAILPYLTANCWHINDNENSRMWNEYVPDGMGIAIKTTVGKLCESFIDTELFYQEGKQIPVHVGEVKYIDRAIDLITYNCFSWERVLHKDRAKFSHERELRVGIDLSPPYFGLSLDTNQWQYYPQDKIPVLLKQLIKVGGVLIPVNLNTLIDTVVISPSASGDFKEKIEQLLTANNISARVEKSTL